MNLEVRRLACQLPLLQGSRLLSSWPSLHILLLLLLLLFLRIFSASFSALSATLHPPYPPRLHNQHSNLEMPKTFENAESLNFRLRPTPPGPPPPAHLRTQPSGRVCSPRGGRHGPIARLPTTFDPLHRHQHAGVSSVSEAPSQGANTHHRNLTIPSIMPGGVTISEFHRSGCWFN